MTEARPKPKLGDLNGRWTALIKLSSVLTPFVFAGIVAIVRITYSYGERIRALEQWKETIVEERTRYQDLQTTMLVQLQADLRTLTVKVDKLAERN